MTSYNNTSASTMPRSPSMHSLDGLLSLSDDISLCSLDSADAVLEILAKDDSSSTSSCNNDAFSVSVVEWKWDEQDGRFDLNDDDDDDCSAVNMLEEVDHSKYDYDRSDNFFKDMPQMLLDSCCMTSPSRCFDDSTIKKKSPVASSVQDEKIVCDDVPPLVEESDNEYGDAGLISVHDDDDDDDDEVVVVAVKKPSISKQQQQHSHKPQQQRQQPAVKVEQQGNDAIARIMSYLTYMEPNRQLVHEAAMIVRECEKEHARGKKRKYQNFSGACFEGLVQLLGGPRFNEVYRNAMAFTVPAPAPHPYSHSHNHIAPYAPASVSYIGGRAFVPVPAPAYPGGYVMMSVEMAMAHGYLFRVDQRQGESKQSYHR